MRKLQILKLGMWLFSLLLIQHPAKASSVIYDNGAPNVMSQNVSDYSIHESYSQVGDDFILSPGATTITGVNWWGSYANDEFPDDNFTIRLFNFVSPGIPATSPFYQVNVGAASRINTGMSGPTAFNIYAYSAAIPSIDLNPDTYYLLSVVNNTPGDIMNSWAWATADAANSAYARFGGSPAGIESNGWYRWDNTAYAFNLTGLSTVPVPAAVWLFGSGLLGLIGVARRKAA